MMIRICHDDRLVERKSILTEVFKGMDIPALEWIEDFRAGDLKMDHEARTADGSIKNKVTVREYSLYLKHYLCYERTVSDGGWSVIFEDDVVVPSNLMVVLERCFNSDYDFISLSDRGNRGNSNGYSYDMGNIKFTRVAVNTFTHAQVLNAKAAEVLMKFKYPCSRPIDIHLFEKFRSGIGLKVACLSPGFDQNKSLKSSLRDKNRVIEDI